MVEDRRWPAAPGWMEQIKLLAERTEQGLRAYAAEQARADAL
jgi:hypothetical protein